MKHCRKFADFARFFADADYVAERLAAIMARASRTPDDCIELGGYRDRKGYTKACFGGVQWPAHRLIWMIEHGDIGGLVIDHKCRNTSCINLAHIEPVTNQENVKRGKLLAHGETCRAGHPYILLSSGWRECPTCRSARMKAKYAADPEYRAQVAIRRKRNRELEQISQA